MKIVKEFQFDEMAGNRNLGALDARASFGLGDDEELYFKGAFSGHSFRTVWYPMSKIGFGLSLSEMKAIFRGLGIDI
jgi:hypothetical protein